jgi:RNA polymerase sigma-70 factor (ECF subfamily)
MTESRTQPTTTPPNCPVRSALDDPALRDELRRHAQVRLTFLLANRPHAARLQLIDDVIQETAGRALACLATFNAALATPAGWIHGILNNVLSEQCRAFRKQPIQPIADPDGWDRLTARITDAPAELAELLTGLTPDQRGIIAMHHIDGLSHEEIAAQLAISVGASRVRLNRAMAALKQIAEKGGGR